LKENMWTIDTYESFFKKITLKSIKIRIVYLKWRKLILLFIFLVL
jgi:hypothetical protein